MCIKIKQALKTANVNDNAGESTATVYTADKSVMRKFDLLINEFPEVYKLSEVTEYSKTYEMPKSFVSYRKPRKISEYQRARARELMKAINKSS